MAVTPVPTMTDTPPFPALADRAAGTYNSKAYAFGAHMADTFNDELVSVAMNVLSNATEAVASATIAANAADVALMAAGATTWVAGQMYELNDTVISPADQNAYRKRTASSASALDPSVDPTNWINKEVTAPFSNKLALAQAHAIALSF